MSSYNMVLTLTSLLLIQWSKGNADKNLNTPEIRCPGLRFEGELVCDDPIGNKKGNVARNTCRESQGIGTAATYRCKPRYLLYDYLRFSDTDTLRQRKNNDGEGILRCQKNGTWRGYERFKNSRCKEECGRRVRTNPKPLVVNGVATNSSSWPWHATLYKKKGSEMHYICGGTIIRSTAIMTAAHCIPPQENLEGNSYAVVLGSASNNFSINRDAANTQILYVKRSFVSPNYDERKDFQADITILQLDGTIEYDDSVSPVCLPTDFLLDSNAIQEGRIGDVVGFGVDENDNLSPILKHGRLEIHSHSECFIKLRRTLSQSQFCAGNRRENAWQTVCNGDSGGGLVIPSILDDKYYIHGIVSTGDGSAKHEKLICQNYGVFTRVYSFTRWWRNILEGITGDIEDGVSPTEGVKYSINGTEARRVRFISVPLDFKGRVTAIQLRQVDIDPELLLNSLEYCKTVQHLNFSLVKLISDLPNRRVRLPLLRSISLDILKDDMITGSSSSVPSIPDDHYFQKFVRSLKFFEKDVTDVDSADVTRIAHSQVNVAITVGIFKLITIDHQSGKIALSQLNFAQQILSNMFEDPYAPPFNLTYLALSSCALNGSIELLPHRPELKTLILDQVEDADLQTDLKELLKTSTFLEELVVVGHRESSQQLSVEIGMLPKTLKHISLARVQLELKLTNTNEFKIGQSRLPVPPTTRSTSSIIFPDDHIPPAKYSYTRRNKRRVNVEDTGTVFSNITSFFCDLCLSTHTELVHLPKIFPNLKQLILRLPDRPPAGTSIKESVLQHFKYLEFAVFLTPSSSVSADGTAGVKYTKPGQAQTQKSQKTKSIASITKMSHAEEIHLNYIHNRGQNFWTSQADFVCGIRLTSYERSAFDTGHYIFKGVDGKQQFSSIPVNIQSRLKTVAIKDADVSTGLLLNSLRSSSGLKSLRLFNVSSLYILNTETVDLPNLIEYRSERTLIPIWEALAYDELAPLMDTYLPFQFFHSEADNPNFNFQTTFLQSRVQKIHIQFGKCVQVSWDSTQGALTTISGYTNDWLRNGPPSNVTVRSLALQYFELDPASVPSTVTHLNLNFVILSNPNSLFKKLTALKDLKFINVRSSSDYKDLTNSEWEWLDLNLALLARIHSKSLQHLSIERANLRNYSKGVKFENVQFLYLESCTYEKDFLKDFMSVFPNMKKLVILDHYSTGDYYTTQILLAALRSGTMQWVLSRCQPDTSPVNKNIQGCREMLSSLKPAGISHVNIDSHGFFIVQRLKGSRGWVGKEYNGTRDVKSELLRVKGMKMFGASQECHAYKLSD